MNILQIISSTGSGSKARYVSRLAHDLSERKHVTHVACPPGSSITNWLPPEHRLELPLNRRWDITIPMKLARFIRHQEVDIIQAHSTWDYFIAWLARAMARQGKIMFTRHEQTMPTSNVFTRWLWSKADHTVVVAKSMVRRLTHHLDLPAAKITALPYWVDMEHYDADVAPAELPVETQHCVGIIGRIVPEKGQDIFIRAAKLVLAERKDITFLIVGENARTNEAYLASLMSKAGGELLIRFFPWQDDPRPVFAALTALAVTSREESFSHVLLEGMASGVPVIASRGPGPGEIVIHNETGLLIPAEDPRALAEAIQFAVENENRRASWAITAHMNVESNYATEHVIARYETLMQQVCKSGDNPPSPSAATTSPTS